MPVVQEAACRPLPCCLFFLCPASTFCQAGRQAGFCAPHAAPHMVASLSAFRSLCSNKLEPLPFLLHASCNPPPPPPLPPLVQVNKLEITADKTLIAAAGNPHIRLVEGQGRGVWASVHADREAWAMVTLPGRVEIGEVCR